MKHVVFITAISFPFLLGGCSFLSGYDAQSDFSCRAPEGILCESMTGIYANVQAHNLPGQRSGHKPQDQNNNAPHQDVPGVMTRPIHSGTPLRSAPRVLRVWFAPWEDADGDLHDQSYVYLPVDAGRWLIEHNQKHIQDTYRPVRAPSKRSEVDKTSQKASLRPASLISEVQEKIRTGQEQAQNWLQNTSVSKSNNP